MFDKRSDWMHSLAAPSADHDQFEAARGKEEQPRSTNNVDLEATHALIHLCGPPTSRAQDGTFTRNACPWANPKLMQQFHDERVLSAM